MDNQQFNQLISQLNSALSPREKSTLARSLQGSLERPGDEVTRECPILKKITGSGEIRILRTMNCYKLPVNHVVCPYNAADYCMAAPEPNNCSYRFLP